MKKHLLGLVLSLAALAPAAYADVLPSPVTFTVTATADADGPGYTLGHTYTFVYTLGSSFTNTGSNQFTLDPDPVYTYNYWDQELVGHDRMWATVGGTSLTGTFSNPQGPDSTTPYSAVNAYNTNQLDLIASNDSDVDIGLMMADGSTLLGTVQTSISLQGVSFSFPGSYIDPNSYFTGYAGSYEVTGDVQLYTPGYSNIVTFTATDLTISTSAIPEPSTYAAIFGAVVLGFGVYSRRRQARA